RRERAARGDRPEMAQRWNRTRRDPRDRAIIGRCFRHPERQACIRRTKGEGGMKAKAPSTKPQAPGNPKTPSSNARHADLKIGDWSFPEIWDLGFGVLVRAARST